MATQLAQDFVIISVAGNVLFKFYLNYLEALFKVAVLKHCEKANKELIVITYKLAPKESNQLIDALQVGFINLCEAAVKPNGCTINCLIY